MLKTDDDDSKFDKDPSPDGLSRLYIACLVVLGFYVLFKVID